MALIQAVSATIVVLALIISSRNLSFASPIDEAQLNAPDEVKEMTETAFARFSDLALSFKDDILENFGFCITDPIAEWNSAFNFSRDTTFLSNCITKTKGDMLQRLCTSAEIEFYMRSFLESALKNGLKSSNFLNPNKNCNLSSWVSGCEPGWACSIGKDNKDDLKHGKDMPIRNLDCEPCCEGFFCPNGLTCMIPCPLGAYCPLANLNQATGVCEPYDYQVPPGNTNHSCGTADVWGPISITSELFCPAGFFCPSTIEKRSCEAGHYCRTGSMFQTGCFHLANCEKETTNQNITAYGLFFSGGLTLLLVIFYNCSDQALSSRERKHAKSREAAAKSARETAELRQKWRSAKDVARKHAAGFQKSLSRTFSRKKSAKQPELGSSQSSLGSDAVLPVGKKEDPDNLTMVMHKLEVDPETDGGLNVEGEDKIPKKSAPKVKKKHTRSEIFKYAYGQIEKEKALQDVNINLTYSGVISMATDTSIRSRPTIEIAFKDLTLTLRGKKKHLLRCVTGKIMPGRVSALMGPSGAGKTSFLSALAGKARGCTTNGSILINGKAESLQSYKKIIGFVPQDDIVHGNLTVEENLWFSARCRLPAKLQAAEKVLVVERVIEALGLQPVRDSLVGTVEKRGISGGQRKRVNVGLEMVMEPSLLILDEPTSGLDSSSSQLLLRALRREALEGVNICMVVHQPSYTLFRMFDDLILLAKGGLLAYLGPVKKVEEYFAGLGINVPDRVNPPDHFIDILEGIEKPDTSSGVNYKELPLRWMLHNGYPVPPDMQTPGGHGTPSTGDDCSEDNSSAVSSDEQTLIGGLWQDMKTDIRRRKDRLKFNFLKLKDLSNRHTPGVFRQYRFFLGRLGKQRLREARIQAVDYLLLLIAGICLGTLAKVSDSTFGAVGYTYTIIAVSLLTKIAALRSFSLDKLHYWRESASGINSLSYFLAKDTIDHFNTLIKPAVYLSMFYSFNNPRSSIADNYIVLVCLLYCVTGLAYILAISLEPGSAQLWSVLLPVVLTLIANQQGGGSLLNNVQKFCYPTWALEAFILVNAERYPGVWLITRCAALYRYEYRLGDKILCLLILLGFGLVFRSIALFCLLAFHN